jgi:hypothetical protein
MTPFLAELQIRNIVKEVIEKHLSGIAEPISIDRMDFNIQDKFIIELTSENKISNAIFETMFPRIAVGEFDHYTTMSNFKSMFATSEVWLSQIKHRLSEHELWQFAEDHDLRGYLTETKGNPAFYRELAEDLFFLSLSRPNKVTENELWDGFGAEGRGVRLRLRITPAYADLRNVYYGPKPTVLKLINDELTLKVQRPFIPRGVSRLCAFYLPMNYNTERETRLLVKRFAGVKGPWAVVGGRERCVIPIGRKNDAALIELTQVGMSKIDTFRVEEILSASSLSGIPIINSKEWYD